MKLLLDTNICIYVIKRRPAAVRVRFEEHEVGDVGLSSVTLSELSYGVAKSRAEDRNREALERFLAPLEIVDYGPAAAAAYGTIRAQLERRGEPIGAMDLMIAAHAMSLGVTLVTNNLREFERVEGLTVENWVEAKAPPGSGS